MCGPEDIVYTYEQRVEMDDGMECDPINEEVGRGQSLSSGVIWTSYQMLESIKSLGKVDWAFT